ncbi:MAG TPA: SIMPL domain-containing protein [Steroidobacteraceae bacterium]|nr:SIMPL domain-containing protein [Steroidobacteraceae bacterium]
MRSAPPRVVRVPCAALLLASAALAAPAWGQAPAAPAPTLSSIRVTGDARISARPDRVQIDLGVQTQAPLSADAASANARQLDAVLAAVRKAAGSAAQLRTVSYSLTPVYQYRSGAASSGGEPTVTGYTALNVVQVMLDDLARIGDVIDAATRAGANRVQGIQWTLRDQDTVRAQALREAATRAHAEAEVLAQALNLRILRVLTVEESSPQIVPVRVHMAVARATAGAAETPTPVEAGTLDVSANVALTVEVGPAAH